MHYIRWFWNDSFIARLIRYKNIYKLYSQKIFDRAINIRYQIFEHNPRVYTTGETTWLQRILP